jgi:hypothetical protein
VPAHVPSAFIIAALTTVDRAAVETADTVVDLEEFEESEEDPRADLDALDAIGQCVAVFADSLDHAIGIVHVYVAGRGSKVLSALPIVVPEARIARLLPDERRAGMMCPIDLVVVFRRPADGRAVAPHARMEALNEFCRGVLLAEGEDDDGDG